MSVRELRKRFEGGNGGVSTPNESSNSPKSPQSATSTEKIADASPGTTTRKSGTYTLSFMEENLRQQRLLREAERSQRSDAIARAASTKTQLGLFDQKTSDATRSQKELDKRAKEATQAMLAQHKGTGNLDLLHASAALAKKTRDDESNAKAQTSALYAQHKGTGDAYLLSQSATIARKARDNESYPHTDAHSRQHDDEDLPLDDSMDDSDHATSQSSGDNPTKGEYDTENAPENVMTDAPLEKGAEDEPVAENNSVDEDDEYLDASNRDGVSDMVDGCSSEDSLNKEMSTPKSPVVPIIDVRDAIEVHQIVIEI